MVLSATQLLLLAAVISSLFVAGYLVLAKRFMPLDQPGQRSSHRHATPTGAGVACVLALLVMVALHTTYPASWIRLLLPGACLLSLLGLVDDMRPLSIRLRLLAQLLLAITLVLLLPHSLPLWSSVLLVLWLLWSVNSFNFMDGSHGMAAWQAISASLLLAFFFWQASMESWAFAAMTLAAVVVGFLPWNFPKARVFLGDAGSLPIGWLLAGLTAVAVMEQALSLPMALLLLALFHVDTGMTLLLRMFRGEEWYTPHRQHLYQRLLSDQGGHGRVALAYQAVNVTIVYPLLILTSGSGGWEWAVFVSLLGLLLVAWTVLHRNLESRLKEER